MGGCRRYSISLVALAAALVTLTPAPMAKLPAALQRVTAGASSEEPVNGIAADRQGDPDARASRSEPALQYHVPPGDTPVPVPPAVFDEPAAPPAPPPAALAAPPPAVPVPATTWAVVIGINDYPGERADLRSGVDDALDVSQALLNFGVPAEHILVVLDTQATADVIRASLGWLTERAQADSTAVLFYAGHIRKLTPHTEALVAADGRLISDAEVANRLASLRAQQTWIALAGCYAGGFQEVLAPGRVLTAAADANELAYENTGFGRSYMVEYMVRQAMLEQRAASDVQEAFAYAHAAIQRDYPGREPVQYDQAHRPLDLRPATRQAEPPPPPPPPPAQPEPHAPPPSSPSTTQPPPRQPASQPGPERRCIKLAVQMCR